MADMTWNSLTDAKTRPGSIKSWINYDHVTFSSEDVIAEAEDWMAMFLRVRDMQQYISLNNNFIIPEGDGGFPLNAKLEALSLPEFLDPIFFFLVGYGYLRYVAQDEIDRMRWPDPNLFTTTPPVASGSISSGTPCRYTIIGDGMIFDCAADQQYWLTGAYYARPPALSEDNQTNVYTTKLRKIFKEVLLGCAYQMQKDNEQQAYHIQQALALIQQKKVTDDLYLRAQEQDVRMSYA